MLCRLGRVAWRRDLLPTSTAIVGAVQFVAEVTERQSRVELAVSAVEQYGADRIAEKATLLDLQASIALCEDEQTFAGSYE
jgi:hypothetical protein